MTIHMTQEELNKKLLDAVYNNNISEVEKTLSLGADVNSTYGNGWTVLMLAAYYGHIDIARLLIEHGAYIHVVNKYGNTALMWACRNGRTDIAKLLIEHGADINIRNSDGYTALDILKKQYKYKKWIETAARKKQLDTEDSLTDPKQEQPVDWNI